MSRDEFDRGAEARTIVEEVAAMDLLQWLQSQSVSIPEAIWALAVVIKQMQDVAAR